MLYFTIMPVSGKKVACLLLKYGWRVVSQRGSHIKLEKGTKKVIIPIHSNRDLGIGLLRKIEKQSGGKIL